MESNSTVDGSDERERIQFCEGHSLALCVLIYQWRDFQIRGPKRIKEIQQFTLAVLPRK